MAVSDNLKITLIVASITAVATLGGSLGGTYLGGASNLRATREQLRHDELKRQYQLKQGVYVTMMQTADTYLADINSIFIDGGHPVALARKLDRDSFAAGNAADEIDIVGSAAAAAKVDDLMPVLNKAQLDTPFRRLDKLTAKAVHLLREFSVVARADLRAMR